MKNVEKLFFMRPELIEPLQAGVDNIACNGKVPADMQPLMQEVLRQMLMHASLGGWALLRHINETDATATSTEDVIDIAAAMDQFKDTTVFMERAFLTIAYLLYSPEIVREMHDILTKEAVKIERAIRAARDPAAKFDAQPPSTTTLQ